MKRNLNIIGPQIRRLRNAMGWSQNCFAIKLQLLGMEAATRKKVAKIESREVWVSDDDLLFISRGPSQADHRMTRQMSGAARLLQIQLLDHVVTGDAEGGRQPYFSFREAGCL